MTDKHWNDSWTAQRDAWTSNLLTEAPKQKIPPDNLKIRVPQKKKSAFNNYVFSVINLKLREHDFNGAVFQMDAAGL